MTGSHEVRGSTPLGSTILLIINKGLMRLLISPSFLPFVLGALLVPKTYLEVLILSLGSLLDQQYDG